MVDNPQVTPPEIRQSIYRKAVVELHNKIGVDYVDWMEDTAASVFETFTEIDTTTYPETFGPRDEDPLVHFNEWLANLPRPAYDPYSHYESRAEEEGANGRMKDPFINAVMKRHKEAKSSSPAQVSFKPIGEYLCTVLTLSVTTSDDPWPEYLHPREVLMTAKMMEETLTIGNGDDGLPENYEVLGDKGFHILGILRNPQIKPRQANAEEVLNLRPDWSDEELHIASEKVKDVNTKIKAYNKTISGAVSGNPIWGKWEEESELLLNSVPLPLSPPLFPLKEAVADLPQLPETFKDLEGTVGEASHSRLRLSGSRAMTGRGLGPRWATDNDSQEFLEQVMSSNNLDKFDGVPFAPLTPKSVDKHSRLQPIQSQATFLPPSPPPTHSRNKRMPWEENPRIEPPLMPARFDLPSSNSHHIDQLFTPVRNSSPPLPPVTVEGRTDIATPSLSGVAEQMEDSCVQPINKVLRDILSTTQLDTHKEREGYGTAEETAFAHATSEELDTTKTNHIGIPNITEEAYSDPRNNLPMSYSGLADSLAGGVETDRMLFVKYPGVSTALASELDWDPYRSHHHSPVRHDHAANVSALPDPPASQLRHSSGHLPGPVHHPADAAIRSLVERPMKKMTPVKPRWMTIQDAEREEALKSSNKKSLTSSALSETTTLPATYTPSPAAKGKTNKRKKGQVIPGDVGDMPEDDGLVDAEIVTITPTPKSTKEAVGDSRKKRKAAESLKAPSNPTLDDILMSIVPPPQTQESNRERTGHSKELSTVTLTRPTNADPSTLSGFLHLQNLGHLAGQDAEVACKQAVGQDLSAIFEEDEEGEPVNWRADPAIQNPSWYDRASQGNVQPYANPMPVIAKVDLFKNRPLIKALESQNFYLFDNRDLQGADLVISPVTAVIFRSLQTLPDVHVQLLEQLKEAASFYHHVILVFETISFVIADKHEDAGKCANPLGVEIIHALGSLKRGQKAAWQGDADIIGKVEFVFACEGANEVVRGVMGALESDEAMLKDRMGEEEYQRYGGRRWMQSEPVPDHEATLIDTFGVNTFNARFATVRHGGAERLAYDMSAEERLLLLGPVWGEDVVIRFNDVLKSTRSDEGGEMAGQDN
ncbi:hypothetical protein L198_01965 [Cryptococcus wingfieldii CBS 7118]|uniref:Uncharacterized protein n=1 Tax=Cryptococcus wingfieldii CBS 7118 TaxID=1295528 RepID=A0A1E3JWV1_9TREE|nr:hypothetical protein L198_01965 [Cryptococcus wingfieldii CBS 7118]ODO05273.1 hypothetical protein L198_01965 [Cryptococcus wingfieldii CBS 7118]